MRRAERERLDLAQSLDRGLAAHRLAQAGKTHAVKQHAANQHR